MGRRPRRADQYTDCFWPTVDRYRLPGTTVSTKRLADSAGGEWGEPKPAVRWVGGATDGEFAAIGQHLKGLGSTLEARKSWFCLADTIVCLGAGITGHRRRPRRDGRRQPQPGGGRHPDPRTGSRVGPPRRPRRLGLPRPVAPCAPSARTAPAPGPTSTPAAPPKRRTRRWQTLWLDHGTDPVDASYAYVLLPGASRRTVAARAADRHWLSVLANDGGRQAVAVPSLGLTAANFWRAGRAGPLTASARASVLVRRRGRTATLSVSEPPRTGEALEITWDRPVRAVLRARPGVEVLATGRRLRLRVTPGMACATP